MFQMKSMSELTTCAQFPPEVFMTKTEDSEEHSPVESKLLGTTDGQIGTSQKVTRQEAEIHLAPFWTYNDKEDLTGYTV